MPLVFPKSAAMVSAKLYKEISYDSDNAVGTKDNHKPHNTPEHVLLALGAFVFACRARNILNKAPQKEERGQKYQNTGQRSQNCGREIRDELFHGSHNADNYTTSPFQAVY